MITPRMPLIFPTPKPALPVLFVPEIAPLAASSCNKNYQRLDKVALFLDNLKKLVMIANMLKLSVTSRSTRPMAMAMRRRWVSFCAGF
jgi:hypothetical protein